MAASGDDQDQDKSHLQGFVIITLPPPNNPSLGKTITAFTLPNSPPQHQSQPQQSQPPPPPEIIPLSSDHTNETILTYPLRIFLLGLSLFALLAFCSLQTPQNLLKFTSSNNNENKNEDDDKKTSSFVFPLYSKLGFGEMSRVRDVEVKLGKFLMFGGKNAVLPVDDGRLMSAEVEASSSVVLPVNGDELRDGYAFIVIIKY